MFPILNIGPLAIQTPGLILLLGVWLSLTFAEKQSSKTIIPTPQLDNLILTGLLAGILGARLSYAMQHVSAFTTAPLSLFSLTPTMLDASGGILIGVLSMFIYGQRKKLSLPSALDALTPFLMGMQFFIPLANLASGSGFGAASNMPWAISLWGAMRHPSQVYEMFSALVILFLVLSAHSKIDLPGFTFWRFLSLAATSLLFLEAYRGDSLMVAGNFRLAQGFAWCLLALSLWRLGILIKAQNARTETESQAAAKVEFNRD